MNAALVRVANAAGGASQIKAARVLRAVVPAAHVLAHPARIAVLRQINLD